MNGLLQIYKLKIRFMPLFLYGYLLELIFLRTNSVQHNQLKAELSDVKEY